MIDENYKFLDFKTYIHSKENENDKTRLAALVGPDIINNVVQRVDLQIPNYPSICLEVTVDGRHLICSAVYRQWGKNQLSEMNGIIDSIDRVGEENKQHVVMSDMNLDTSRFEEKNYPYKKLRDGLLNCLAKMI